MSGHQHETDAQATPIDRKVEYAARQAALTVAQSLGRRELYVHKPADVPDPYAGFRGQHGYVTFQLQPVDAGTTPPAGWVPVPGTAAVAWAPQACTSADREDVALADYVSCTERDAATVKLAREYADVSSVYARRNPDLLARLTFAAVRGYQDGRTNGPHTLLSLYPPPSYDPAYTDQD